MTPDHTPGDGELLAEALKPCPFGCSPVPYMAYGGVAQRNHYPDERFRMHCSCGAIGPNGDTPAEAVAAWNRRAPTTPGEENSPSRFQPCAETGTHIPSSPHAFTSLRRANEARQVAWANGDAVGLLFRATELGGECGEVLNVCKKIERERSGWRGSRATTSDLADELADVVICADLLALTEGIDLGAAVIRKFNATSEKVGLPHRLLETAND